MVNPVGTMLEAPRGPEVDPRKGAWKKAAVSFTAHRAHGNAHAAYTRTRHDSLFSCGRVSVGYRFTAAIAPSGAIASTTLHQLLVSSSAEVCA